MDEIMTYVSGYGFPIVVSGYLLVRIEERLKELDRTIGELARTIDRFLTAAPQKI